MERIHGVPIGDIAKLRELGTDFKRLAENGVEIFFTQVFRHNFFHADMHPGNVFVQLDDPKQPRYAAVDFGIVGTLDWRDQRYLAENFLAVFDRDYRRVANCTSNPAGFPPLRASMRWRSAVRTICEPIFDAAQGNLFRRRAAATVRSARQLQDGSPTAAAAAAKDAARTLRAWAGICIRTWTSGRPPAAAAALDARAHEPAQCLARAASRRPGRHRDPQGTAAAGKEGAGTGAGWGSAVQDRYRRAR